MHMYAGGGREGIWRLQHATVPCLIISCMGFISSGRTDGAEVDRERPERRRKSKSDELGNLPCDGVGASCGTVGVLGATSGKPAGSTASVNDFISKTRMQGREGLKPSGPELVAYARYLGIDPVVDHDLLWIAVQALEAPLPSEWSEHFDSSDRIFYYNASTRVSSWTHPLEQVYRDTYATIIRFRNSNLSLGERAEQLHKLQVDCEEMERAVHEEIGLWTEHADSNGHRFYHNASTKHSAWTDPRPAKCHTLYLRMKMIRVMEACMRSAHGEAKDTRPRLGSKTSMQEHEQESGTEDLRFTGTAGSDASKRPKMPARSDSPELRPSKCAVSVDKSGGGLDCDRQYSGKGSNSVDPAVVESDAPVDDQQNKKKKKKKRRNTSVSRVSASEHRDDDLARNMQTSKSESSVGYGKAVAPLLGSCDEGSQMPTYEQPEAQGVATICRARIRAGIRLQPLTSGDTALQGPSLLEPSGCLFGSASLPELRPGALQLR